MAEFDTDLFVIGGGSGGVRAARIAANHGARVIVAEEYRMGGTCVIRGCVPKKLLVYASHFHQEFEDAKGFGWTVPEPTFDWATLIANKARKSPASRAPTPALSRRRAPRWSRPAPCWRTPTPCGSPRVRKCAQDMCWSPPAARRTMATPSPASST